MPYMIFAMFTFLLSTERAMSQHHLAYVSPNSTVLHHSKKTIQLKTQNNTQITLYLDTKGELEAAEGVNLNRGDIFYPGQGILSLSDIEKRMKSLGEKTYGRWMFTKYQEYGWVYKLNVAVKGEPIFHMVNAYSGQLIGSMSKFAPLQVEGQIAKD